MNNALSHMTFWIIQHIQQVHAQAQALEKDTTMTPEQKQQRSGQIYHTLLSLLVILNPALEFAKTEYPQFAPLIDWADSMLKNAFEQGQVTGTCSCNGCITSTSTPITPAPTPE